MHGVMGNLVCCQSDAFKRDEKGATNKGGTGTHKKRSQDSHFFAAAAAVVVVTYIY